MDGKTFLTIMNVLVNKHGVDPVEADDIFNSLQNAGIRFHLEGEKTRVEVDPDEQKPVEQDGCECLDPVSARVFDVLYSDGLTRKTVERLIAKLQKAGIKFNLEGETNMVDLHPDEEYRTNRNVMFDAKLSADPAGAPVQNTKFDPIVNYPLQARKIVHMYVNDKVDPTDNFQLKIDEVFVVSFTKVLHHWKALVSTTLPDGMYYEVTFNGVKNEVYLDAYKRFDNVKFDVK